MVYQLQSTDTTIEAEQVQIQLLRRFGAIRRFTMLESLSNSTRRWSWEGLNRSRPNLDLRQRSLFFIGLLYGHELAQQIENHFRNRAQFMLNPDLLAALSPVIAIFEELGVNYLIGGSVASSVLGIPRSTQDVDLVADLKEAQITALVGALEPEYYVSEEAVTEAVKRRTAFNLIHQATAYKIDIFVLKEQAFNQVSFGRRQELQLGDSPRPLSLYTPEDIVLQKLVWHVASNHSQKQWLDILGVLKVQENLDEIYLETWANQLGLADLLHQARLEARLDSE